MTLPRLLVMTSLGMLLAACGSSSTDDGGTACDKFADQAPSQTVTVRIKNTGSLPFYFGQASGCGAVPLFSVRDSAGQVLAQRTGSCDFTCEDLQHQSAACTADCAIPPIYRIDPGGSHDVEWAGTRLESAAMPASCYNESGNALASCSREVVAPAATYTVVVTGYISASCGGAPCPCTAIGPGVCQVQGSPALTSDSQREEPLAYPSQTLVELEFA